MFGLTRSGTDIVGGADAMTTFDARSMSHSDEHLSFPQRKA